jgi:hypothetical protein
VGENHSERNRRRRERNAFRNLYEYAQAAGVTEPKKTAQKTARAIHIDGGPLPTAERAAPAAKAAAPAAKPKAKPAAPASKSEATPAAEAAVPHRLDDRTREQLYARAQELEIEGRSQMTKAELIEAIRGAS